MEELGHPYKWVQNLGGLNFPSDTSEVRVHNTVLPAFDVSNIVPVACSKTLILLSVSPACVVCSQARGGDRFNQ